MYVIMILVIWKLNKERERLIMKITTATLIHNQEDIINEIKRMPPIVYYCDYQERDIKFKMDNLIVEEGDMYEALYFTFVASPIEGDYEDKIYLKEYINIGNLMKFSVELEEILKHAPWEM